MGNVQCYNDGKQVKNKRNKAIKTESAEITPAMGAIKDENRLPNSTEKANDTGKRKENILDSRDNEHYAKSAKIETSDEIVSKDIANGKDCEQVGIFYFARSGY